MHELTRDDLQTLQALFELEQHEFDHGGNCYLKEQSITERIETVDPAWQFHIRHIEVRSTAGHNGKEQGIVTVHAALTIQDCTRENTGMAVILRGHTVTKYYDKEENTWKDIPEQDWYSNEANQAEKTATTDALKRCARLFGIGRYILEFPNTVKDTDSLRAHLAKQRDPQDEWLENVETLVLGLYKSDQHMNNSLHRALETELINTGMKPIVAACEMFMHRTQKDYGLMQADVQEILGMTLADYLRSGKQLVDAWQLVVEEMATEPELEFPD